MQSCCVKRLFREIKEQGYRGGYSAVTACLREVRPPSVQLYERRYETPPGQQAQVDFAYFEVSFTDAPGVTQIVWLFTMVLGYSRFLWGRFCPNQKLATVLRCHIDAFDDQGGVPKEILYDRMKTAVVGTDVDDLVVYNPSLVALAIPGGKLLTARVGIATGGRGGRRPGRRGGGARARRDRRN